MDKAQRTLKAVPPQAQDPAQDPAVLLKKVCTVSSQVEQVSIDIALACSLMHLLGSVVINIRDGEGGPESRTFIDQLDFVADGLRKQLEETAERAIHADTDAGKLLGEIRALAQAAEGGAA
ncbi:MAG: hypothetical protein WC713_07375 [Candidatus Methylomirabilota bacterium]